MAGMILVKHAQPIVDATLPPRDWVLSPAGVADSAVLADRLAPHAPDRVVASRERKAVQTGEIVAGRLGIPLELRDGLHEHERTRVPHLGAQEFDASIRRLLANPGALVFGSETAEAARARFGQAVARILSDHPRETLAIVAHGTVISLFCSELAGGDPYELWRRLALPSFIVFATGPLRMVETVERL